MTDYDAMYRSWIAGQDPRARELDWRLAQLPWRHRMLLDRFPVRGRRVLDYGCGDGIFALALAARGAEVTGYDVSAAAITAARGFDSGARRAQFTTEEPGAGVFDLVFCTEVLEHVPDDRAFAAQVLSRARPGGVLVGTTPVGRSFFDPDHRHLYDRASLASILAPLGRCRIQRRYRTPLRNLVPWNQSGAAVFLFQVTRPS
ncbi:MAG TPA: class I SAM-dependent methyltransferase [Gemmatimonadales bacterium]|nr:class I SAM-dependent methyltransferase [Gemmatimonadales bacterium]